MGSRKTVQMNRSAGQQWRAGTGNRLRAQEGPGGARAPGTGSEGLLERFARAPRGQAGNESNHGNPPEEVYSAGDVNPLSP